MRSDAPSVIVARQHCAPRPCSSVSFPSRAVPVTSPSCPTCALDAPVTSDSPPVLLRPQAREVGNLHGLLAHQDLYLVVGASIYRAFTIGRCLRVNSGFYDVFTHGLLELARGTIGRCVRRDLALYVIDVRVLVPDSALDEAPLSFLRCYYPERATADFSDDNPSPDAPSPSAPSPSISAAPDVAESSADDSGYDSADTMPSLRTIEDSSDEDYFSDSSEEPDSDLEEEALRAQGFVVEEGDSDMSDLDI
ncbi:hypothetical protein LXA43DRAFT_1102574 [Ganoderma leucocontextum]|nr:hypothetical protein LXA43DRAFT_1102574 [Ganoderma leucocontextum]